MSELPELGRTRRPGSAPRPEVLQAVVEQGRRRLRRAALAGAGALGTATVMVLGLALAGGGGSDAIVVVPATPPLAPVTATPVSPVPLPEPSPGAPRPAASTRPAGDPQAARTPRPAATPRPTVRPRGSGEPPRAAGAPQRPLPEHRERPDRSGSYGDLCRGSDVTWAPEGHRLCMHVQMSTSVPQYRTVTVELELCSSLSSRGPLQLAFATGREHEVRVRPAVEVDEHRWTWSRHYRFPEGAHELSLAPGECLTWLTPWDTRDDDGVVLPPGDYVVEAAVDAEGAAQWVQQPFRITAD